MVGPLTCEEYLWTLRTLAEMRELPPLKKLFCRVMPGLEQILEGADLDARWLARAEAIVFSMTAAERRAPRRIGAGRRRRIARGSGNPVEAVHDMLEQLALLQRSVGRLG